MNEQTPLHLSRFVLNTRSRAVRGHLGYFRRVEGNRSFYGALLSAFDRVHHHSGGGPEENGRLAGGLLYRIEQPRHHPNGNRGALTVLVQSTEQPDWSVFRNDENGEPYFLRPPETKQFTVELPAGTILRFRLRACPVKTPAIPRSAEERRRSGKRRSGKRRQVYASVISSFAPQLEACSDPAQFRALTERKNDMIRKAISSWLVRKLQPAADIQTVGESEQWLGLSDQTSEGALLDLQIIREASVLLKERTRPGESNHRYSSDFDPVLFEGHLVVRDSETLSKILRKGIGPGKAFGFGLLSLAPA